MSRRKGRAAPDPIDIHAGNRVRLRRTLLGLSQEDLGDALGLTFQQVQKYESGANRISASKLWRLSEILDVPVSFFFDDRPGDNVVSIAASDDVMVRRKTLELVRAFYLIADEEVRERIFSLVKSIAHAGDTHAEGAAE